MDDKNSHKKSIAGYFSTGTKYWKNVYDQSSNQSNSALGLEMIKRKEIIFNYLSERIKSKDQRILDIGCGAGGVLAPFVQKNYNIVGVDITFAMAKDAKQSSKKYKPGGIPCLQGDIESLAFKKNAFGYIICAGVIQYLQLDNKAIEQISKIVADKGVIVLTIPNILRLNNFFDIGYLSRIVLYLNHKIKHALKKKPKRTQKKDPHKNIDFSNRRYFYWQLNKLFEKNNLKIEKVYPIGFGPLTFFRNNIMPVSWYILITEFLEKFSQRNKIFGILKIFANRWVFCLQKVKK